MRQVFVAAAAAIALLAAAAAPALAIVWGEPDNNRHPNVGMIAFFLADGSYSHRCSGTLISPTVVLTAGHCTIDTASARVHFADVVTVDHRNPANGLPGTPHTDPDYTGGFVGDTHDIGVVVLNAPVTGIQPARLPTAGYIDRLAAQMGKSQVRFTIVGYGVQDVTPVQIAERTRMLGEVRLVNLRTHITGGAQIATTGARGTGGATCFGDSGGPFFHNGNIVVAITSWGPNPTCPGTGYAYRTDTASARAFLDDFVRLP